MDAHDGIDRAHMALPCGGGWGAPAWPVQPAGRGGVHAFAARDGVEGRTFRFEVVMSSSGNTGLVEFAIDRK